MTPNLYRRAASVLTFAIVLVAGIAAISYFNRSGTQPLPAAVAQTDKPTPTPTPTATYIPYPTMPGYVSPTDFPTYAVPSMTPVPAGSDSGFDAQHTPVAGYTPVTPHQSSDPWVVSAEPLRIANTTFSTHDATLIISGTVSQVLPSQWSTLNGSRPTNPWANTNTYTIITPVSVTINSYLKGSGLTPNVVLFAVGGTVGADSATWSGDDLFTFAVGDPVIVFLNKDKIDPNFLVAGQNPWQVIEHYTLDNSGNAKNSLRSVPVQQLINEINTALGH
jgi:hypothetical protein